MGLGSSTTCPKCPRQPAASVDQATIPGYTTKPRPLSQKKKILHGVVRSGAITSTRICCDGIDKPLEIDGMNTLDSPHLLI